MEMESPPNPRTGAPGGILTATSRLQQAVLGDQPLAVAQTMQHGSDNQYLPGGFDLCGHGRACPSCGSALVLKIPANPNAGQKSKGSGASATAAALDDDVDLQAVVQKNLKSSLESAHSANLLLQALSFDAATREETRALDLQRVSEGVSYCPECQVHVITSAEELERLFEEHDGGDDGDMEWLRGCLLVAVDDAEVVALRTVASPEVSGPQPSFVSDLKSEFLPANFHETSPPPKKSKPTTPMEFEYDYRHKVATHAMAQRIVKGYSLLEEICPDCEMPMMKPKLSNESECVVCPKLLKKIAKYQVQDHLNDPGRMRGDPDYDPIEAIIDEARAEAPHQDAKSRRTVKPDIAEAKQYVMQRRILGGMDPESKPKPKEDKAGGAGDETGSNATADLTDNSDQDPAKTEGPPCTNPIDWDELLINGRTILSKRLNEGWALSSRDCAGLNCKGTPLLTQVDGVHINLDHCVVCGGSGSGMDGAYERESEYLVKAAELAEKAEREAQPDWEELAGNGRALLSERLRQGWTMSSDNCVGYHCGDMPLTNFEGGPDSCVVCGGSGNGVDGAYENYKPEEIVEEERELVSQELSQLLEMGWVLRESLCVQCLMPLVAENEEVEGNLCILCGHLPANNMHGHQEFEEDSLGTDSYLNEYVNNDEPYEDDETIYDEAVDCPVATFGDENTDEAGRKLVAGWTLPDAGLCHHCQGVQMSPPNSQLIGCIQRGCPSALAEAYTFLPDPCESTGPVRLIGRGFSDRNKDGDDETEEKSEQLVQQKQACRRRGYENDAQENRYPNSLIDDGTEAVGPPAQVQAESFHDEPSVLSDDMSQVRSVASSALGVILVRLDDAKRELEEMRKDGDDARECAKKQVEIASLIERLASAAVRMKRYE
ncbi:hypothetical protein ACHAXT_008699 [Thalassiosira profunda]